MLGTYTAYLRVYEPLAGFGPADQERWRAYLAEGRAVSTVDGPVQEREAMLTGAVTGQLPKLEEAYVRQRDGVPLLCPWDTALRAARTVVQVRRELTAPLAEALVGGPLADAIRGAVAAAHGDGGESVPHLQSANWAVPARWFLLVEQGERELLDGGGFPTAVFATPMSAARRRAARGLVVLRKAIGAQAPVSQGVEQLARWLEAFHPRSVVELDYGRVGALFTADQLAADESAADVAAALAALAGGDPAAAGTAYQRLAGRWRPALLAEHAS